MDSSKKRISDRIYRIIQIKRPSAKGYLAAGTKNLYPACPVGRNYGDGSNFGHFVGFR